MQCGRRAPGGGECWQVCWDFRTTGNLLWVFTCKFQTHPGPFVSLWKPHKSTALKKEPVPGHTPWGQHTEPEPPGRPASISDLPHLAFSIQGGSSWVRGKLRTNGRKEGIGWLAGWPVDVADVVTLSHIERCEMIVDHLRKMQNPVCVCVCVLWFPLPLTGQ